MSDVMERGAVANHMLQLLCDGTCKTSAALSELLEVERRKVSEVASTLYVRGYLEREGSGCYKLTLDGRAVAEGGIKVTCSAVKLGKAGRRPANTIRQRAWTAMRMHRQFTVAEIANAAQNGPKDCKPALKKYIQALVRGGYLQEMARRKPGTRVNSRGFKVYALIRNSGPHAPVLSDDQGVLNDFNLKQVFPCKR